MSPAQTPSGNRRKDNDFQGASYTHREAAFLLGIRKLYLDILAC